MEGDLLFFLLSVFSRPEVQEFSRENVWLWAVAMWVVCFFNWIIFVIYIYPNAFSTLLNMHYNLSSSCTLVCHMLYSISVCSCCIIIFKCYFPLQFHINPLIPVFFYLQFWRKYKLCMLIVVSYAINEMNRVDFDCACVTLFTVLLCTVWLASSIAVYAMFFLPISAFFIWVSSPPSHISCKRQKAFNLSIRKLFAFPCWS